MLKKTPSCYALVGLASGADFPFQTYARCFLLARTCLEGYQIDVFLMKGGLSDVDGKFLLNLDAGALWRRDLFPAPNTSPRDYGAT